MTEQDVRQELEQTDQPVSIEFVLEIQDSFLGQDTEVRNG